MTPTTTKNTDLEELIDATARRLDSEVLACQPERLRKLACFLGASMAGRGNISRYVITRTGRYARIAEGIGSASEIMLLDIGVQQVKSILRQVSDSDLAMADEYALGCRATWSDVLRALRRDASNRRRAWVFDCALDLPAEELARDWWLVTPRLAERLREARELVIADDLGLWWVPSVVDLAGSPDEPLRRVARRLVTRSTSWDMPRLDESHKTSFAA